VSMERGQPSLFRFRICDGSSSCNARVRGLRLRIDPNVDEVEGLQRMMRPDCTVMLVDLGLDRDGDEAFCFVVIR
jgi:hypothetical protein